MAMNVNPKERTETLSMRLTPDEKARIKAYAAAAGLSVTGYLVGRALGDAIGKVVADAIDKRR